jgi:hypothetical protein
MWDFEIGHALALMGRTLPFILLRIAVYGGIAIAYVLATGAGAGLGWAIGGVGGPEARSLVMLTPAAAIAFLFPGGWAAIGVVFALLFTWSLKAALLEPFAIACLMQVYFRAIDGQAPDPLWEERLAQLSRKFARLKDRAAAWAPNAASGGPGRVAS